MIATQATAQMAADKEVVGLLRRPRVQISCPYEILFLNINTIRKSVTGSNIHIEVNKCSLTLDRVLKQFTTFRLLNQSTFIHFN